MAADYNRLTFIRLTIEFDNLLFRRFSWIRQLAHIFLRIFSHHSKVFRFNAQALEIFRDPDLFTQTLDSANRFERRFICR